MMPNSDDYFLACDSCGVVLMRSDAPDECPACERDVVSTGHQAKAEGCTTVSNVTRWVA
ncbi:hypothetical protein SAMN05216388_1017109 [Halorientalis persicus]|uniref:Uncharacterized protein n=2 Tax=Halorientalis persicus TaxID=1367881 RepID=A0A1H8S1A1_9EURY|nr:hypothetical protein SAMN05216388_1017109 [Halorientalis persicus]